MPDLFGAPGEQNDGPLADRMRPRTLDDLIGQDHIVGPGRLLRRAIQADRVSSLIFYGPPGTGKTSLARVIANTTRAYIESLNAVLTGIKDIREAIDRSDERRRLYGRRTILFVDEVHRWNKAQQDALLPWVDNGTVILIGATTENPFFEVNRALVSRSRIFQLKPLTSEDLWETARRTLADRERGYGRWRVAFEAGALEHLVEVAGGDARSLLNALELAVETSWVPSSGSAEDPCPPPAPWPPPEGAEIRISLSAAEESIQRRAVLYDRDGDYHFDTISAFIKSVRGSDPDAALYWLAKMVRAGEDPAFIFRRMIILAGEDVGMADPQALPLVVACAEAFERIGFPEGNFPLAHACLYLATAPKSNTAMCFFDALGEVEKEDAEVPNHLRDANRDAEGFGHGDGYIYPHAYRDHWAAQQYLPRPLRGKTFYLPSRIGYEGRIREEVLRKRELQAAVILGDDAPPEGALRIPAIETPFGGGAKGREGWFKRLESGRSALLLADRDAVLGLSAPARHHRLLIPAANDGLLLWESLRRVPEGLAAALTDTEAAREALLRYTAALDEPEQPVIACYPPGRLPEPEEAAALFATPVFDRILAREPWRRGFAPPEGPGKGRGPGPTAGVEAAKAGVEAPPTAGVEAALAAFAASARRLLAPGGNLVILQSPPRLGERISRVLREECGAPEALTVRLEGAEQDFFSAPGGGDPRRWTWDGGTLEGAFAGAGFKTSMTILDQGEERLLLERDLAAWFDRDHSPWGAFIEDALGPEDFGTIRELLTVRAKEGPLRWKWKSLLLKCLGA
jgi:putative ATPase